MLREPAPLRAWAMAGAGTPLPQRSLAPARPGAWRSAALSARGASRPPCACALSRARGAPQVREEVRAPRSPRAPRRRLFFLWSEPAARPAATITSGGCEVQKMVCVWFPQVPRGKVSSRWPRPRRSNAAAPGGQGSDGTAASLHSAAPGPLRGHE